MSDNNITTTENKEESLDELLNRVNNNDNKPSTNDFTVVCDIGKDDYRAFLYYSVLGKNRIVTAVFFVLPILASLCFTFSDGKLNILNFILITLVLYVISIGAVIFRTERSMKKMQKNTPEALRLTKTIYNFRSDAILHTKSGSTIRVPYKNFTKYGKTNKRFFLYFAGKKAMVVRTDDIIKVKSLDDFENYIKSKINK